MAIQPYTVTSYDPSALINQYYAASQQAYAANLQRMKQAESIYDKIIAMYGESGAYGAGYLAQLAGQKVQDVSKAEQAAIGRGLYGLRGYGAEWEATVGAPARLKLEDVKMERLSGALAAKAGFLTGIEQPYPDYSALMQATAAQTSVPSVSSLPTYGGTSLGLGEGLGTVQWGTTASEGVPQTYKPGGVIPGIGAPGEPAVTTGIAPLPGATYYGAASTGTPAQQNGMGWTYKYNSNKKVYELYFRGEYKGSSQNPPAVGTPT